MTADTKRGFFAVVREPWFVLGLATLAVHLLFNQGYGIFRDEMYFIVCGQHPAWGYVDQPPLIPLLAAWSHWLFGDNLVGFRLIPALVLSATVGMTAAFAREIGGGRFAQWLAGLCAMMSPQFLAIGLLFTTDTFLAAAWLGFAWILVRLSKSGDERWWLAFGAVAGLCLLTKYTIGFYMAALAVGLLATPLRKSLLRPWVYAGVLLTALLVLPNVLWQAAHGWPFLALGQAAMNGKNVALSPLSYFLDQLLLIGPAAAPIWIAGLWACLDRPRDPVFRVFPIAYALLFAFFVFTHGKAYFLSSFYPVLLAIGSVAIEGWFRRGRFVDRAVRFYAVASVALAGIAVMPLTVPMLSEPVYIRYAAAIGLAPSATAAEHLKMGLLPQHYADMHGWPEMAAKIAKVYWALPPQDRAKAVFYGRNYGEAAAIDVFGRRLGLPPAISGHNNYWIWGPRGHDGSVVIELGGTREGHEKDFRSVELAGWIESPYAMPYETDQPIWVERGLKTPLKTLWPKLKHYE